MSASRSVDRVLAAWLAVLVVGGLALFARAPADDAYIVARYAANFWQGHGLVYNVGERINALTSPAGFAAMALVAPFAADPVRAWQAVAAFAAVAALVALAWRTYATPPLRILFLALALGSPFVLLWTVGGLETPLLYAVAAWLAALALAPAPLTTRRAVAILALATLAVLTRYDAVLFAAPVALAALWQRRHDASVRATVAVGVALVAAWLAFCAWYFGDLLPTPFYVKLQGAAGTAHLASGSEYVLSFAVLAWLPMALAWRGGAAATPAPAPMRHATWLGLALVAVYGVVAGSVHMMYAYRFFVPWLPVLWLCLLPRTVATQLRPRIVRLAGLALALQTLLLGVVWQYSQNPNLSLALGRQTALDERHELSLVGARDGAATAAALRAQAGALRMHWRAQPAAATRPPRAAVDTGGIVPFLVPGLYAFDRLVSYRHDCASPAQLAADYWQVFRVRLSGAAQPAPPAPGWRAVNVQTLALADATGAQYLLDLELWFQPAPAPLLLPPSVNGGCLAAADARG